MMNIHRWLQAGLAVSGLAVLTAGIVAVAVPSNADSLVADGWAPLRLPGALEVENYSDPLHMRDASDLVVVGWFTDFRPGRTATVPDGLGDGVDDQLFWVEGTVEVEEVIAVNGPAAPELLSAGAGSLTVEFFAGGLEAQPYIDDDVRRLDVALGDEIGRSVLFLRLEDSPLGPDPADPCRDWPAEELAVFGMTREDCDAATILGDAPGGATPAVSAPANPQLVWSYGLIAETDRRPVDAPLGEVPDEHTEEESGAHSGFARAMESWQSLDEFIAYLRG